MGITSPFAMMGFSSSSISCGGGGEGQQNILLSWLYFRRKVQHLGKYNKN
jgi:hypothetical protein